MFRIRNRYAAVAAIFVTLCGLSSPSTAQQAATAKDTLASLITSLEGADADAAAQFLTAESREQLAAIADLAKRFQSTHRMRACE